MAGSLTPVRTCDGQVAWWACGGVELEEPRQHVRGPVMTGRRSWRALRRDWVRAIRVRMGRRAYRLAAAATAVMVAAALTLAGIEIAASSRPGAPVQPAGTAAGRPHKVPASATIAALSGD